MPVFGDSTPILCAGRQFTDYRTVPVAIDLDRDGRKDLVLGEWYSSVRFYRNEGTDSVPLFLSYDTLVPADPDSFLNGNPPRVNFTDWDGDTDMDMVTCDYYGSVFLRRNITQVGVEERCEPQAADSKPRATVVRDVLVLSGSCESRVTSCWMQRGAECSVCTKARMMSAGLRRVYTSIVRTRRAALLQDEWS